MSDEVPPAPLRLKPRVKSDSDNPAATPVVPAVSAPETSPGSEAPRLKLRPKLDTSSAAADNVPAPAPPTTAEAPPPSLGLRPRLVIAPPDVVPPASENLPPKSEVPPAIAPTESPKFKLKEKATIPSHPQPVAAGAVPVPPILTPPPAPQNNPPPTFPVVANQAAQKPAPTLPPPKVKAEVERPIEVGADPGQSSFAKVILVVAAFVLLIGVYYGYKKLTAKPAVTEPTVTEAPKRPASPSKTLNDLGAMPAQAIAKAEAVVAAVNAKEEGRMEDVLGEQQMPVRPPRKVAPKPPEQPAATTSTTDLAPGVKATTTAKDVDGDASPEFRNWVAQARVSGVFQGTPARVLINGKTVPAGQIVDDALGITFEGVDPTAKLLIFRDASGVSVTRKF